MAREQESVRELLTHEKWRERVQRYLMEGDLVLTQDERAALFTKWEETHYHPTVEAVRLLRDVSEGRIELRIKPGSSVVCDEAILLITGPRGIITVGSCQTTYDGDTTLTVDGRPMGVGGYN